MIFLININFVVNTIINGADGSGIAPSGVGHRLKSWFQPSAAIIDDGVYIRKIGKKLRLSQKIGQNI